MLDDPSGLIRVLRRRGPAIPRFSDWTWGEPVVWIRPVASIISVVEFPDRVLVTNVGDFLPGDVEAVIWQNAPQANYRNPFLADAMVELNLIDTQGGGIKRMFETQRRRSFPLLDYDLTDAVGTTERRRVRLVADWSGS